MFVTQIACLSGELVIKISTHLEVWDTAVWVSGVVWHRTYVRMSRCLWHRKEYIWSSVTLGEADVRSSVTQEVYTVWQYTGCLWHRKEYIWSSVTHGEVGVRSSVTQEYICLDVCDTGSYIWSHVTRVKRMSVIVWHRKYIYFWVSVTQEVYLRLFVF